ncbi:MAG: class I SAM-dependent methyltransferase [Pseudobdellovibrionaceae bacterium]
MSNRVRKKTLSAHFDKYDLYREAVQSPDTDVLFLQDVYQELRNKKPKVLREDFCGTFALSAEWIKLDKKHVAYGIDIDPEPMAYGMKNYYSKLTPTQQKRLHLIEGNVLTSKLPLADFSVAMNFSYFCFKSREVMKQYFKNALQSLNKNGLFLVDLFGGTQCTDAIVDRTKKKGFLYFWDQQGFDPVSHEALFYIHFQVGKQKMEKAYTYDWRMWSIPEIREIMTEVGFKKTHVYWEGTNKSGGGNGIFTRTEQGESCLSWIAYVIGEK